MLLLRVIFKDVATDDIYHLVFHAADVMQEVFQQWALSRESPEIPLRCFFLLTLGHRVSTFPSAPTHLQTLVTLGLYWWRWTIVHVDVPSFMGPALRVVTLGH